MEVGDIMMYPFSQKFFDESRADKTKVHYIMEMGEKDPSKEAQKTYDSN